MPRPIDRTATRAGRGRWSLKQLLIAAGAVLLIAAAAGYGNYYWRTGRFLVSTDDAYVQAHSVLISPKVSGYLSEAPVDDNQPVKAGEVLARIDPRDYQTALDQARANVAAAQAAIDTLSQQIDQQKLVVRAGPPSGRVGSSRAGLFAAGFPALHPIGQGRLGHRATVPTGAGRHSGKRRDAAARRRGCLRRREADWRLQGAARPGRRDARPAAGDASTRPSSTSATRRSRRRSTARSASAPCGSANTCRPARS